MVIGSTTIPLSEPLELAHLFRLFGGRRLAMFTIGAAAVFAEASQVSLSQPLSVATRFRMKIFQSLARSDGQGCPSVIAATVLRA
jgi:hypothetical protein